MSATARQNRMKAVTPLTWGPPDVLQEIEIGRPTAKAGEILIRVRACGVNPTDWKSRSTGGRGLWNFPPILGHDVSGVVESVAAGSVLFRPGDEVFGMPLFPHQAGAYAEYLAAPARHFALKPKNIDHIHAAAIPLAGLTAWQALVDGAGLREGQRVLVHGAAGGVGHLAVQIAKSLGAHVIATARSARHDFVHGLGADEVIDYSAGDFEARISNVDIVIDPFGGETASRSLQVLRPGGSLVSLVPRVDHDFAQHAEDAGVDYRVVLVEPDRFAMNALARLAAEGQLRPHVSRVLPLAAAREAHELGESGHAQGKIILTP